MVFLVGLVSEQIARRCDSRARRFSDDDHESRCVLIPTYNERENLPLVVAGVLAHPDINVLVIDDGSPDGTGALADRLATTHPGRVSVMHRTGARGLGRSYLDGFRAALQSRRDFVCQMDADLSHDPRFLPSLVAAAAGGADLMIGSRYMEGGRVENWPLRRKMLSAFANTYIRTATGLRVRDCTSGYRCWRREALARLPLDAIASDGYSFLVEVTFQAARGRPDASPKCRSSSSSDARAPRSSRAAC